MDQRWQGIRADLRRLNRVAFFFADDGSSRAQAFEKEVEGT
jgi:hypothetical protein